jgi:chorismate synthase
MNSPASPTGARIGHRRQPSANQAHHPSSHSSYTNDSITAYTTLPRSPAPLLSPLLSRITVLTPKSSCGLEIPLLTFAAASPLPVSQIATSYTSTMQMSNATTGPRQGSVLRRQNALKPHVRSARARSVRVLAAGSSYGHMFRVTTFGESHGGGCGCIVDGVPARLNVSLDEIQYELDRRRPGQSRITTPRSETDTAEILSGMSPDGVTTLGTPICVLVRYVGRVSLSRVSRSFRRLSSDVFLSSHFTVSFFLSFRNKDQKSQDYSEMEKAYRPSHADATYDFKYGIRAVAGGGRSSARETIGRVAAGAIAKKLLKTVAGCEVFAYVNRVRDVESNVDHSKLTMEAIESNPVRCPDQEAADLMYKAIDEVRTRGESCGGEVTIVVKNCPKGLGAPVFDKLEAEMAKALMSLPATKGFEIGSGFSGSKMLGSEHNDEFYIEDGKVRTRTNRSGGVQGGISNGEDIVMKIAFKPTAVR